MPPIGGAQVVIALQSVSKTYPRGHFALRDLDLDVEASTTLALLGPSGCGKTTTLRLINRLIEPTAGRVLVNGRDVSTVDPIELRRSIGYVVQNAGLFPHMTARDNAETVTRLLGWPRDRRRERCADLFSLVGLDFDEIADRYPNQLSGGQQQRVGLARALAADPPLVLLDEPFGALDPITRRKLQTHFLQLKASLRKTMVLVTHDVDEALRLADRIAILIDGRIAQVGSPHEIRASPQTADIAELVASSSDA